MDPATAVPSYRVFRGSLAALLIGSVAAVWLLVLPPARADQDRPPTVATGTASPRPGATQPTGGAGQPTPGATASTTPSATATSTPTSTPTPTATPSARTYTVQSGDTMLAIAQRFTPAGGNVTAVSEAIMRANNISNPASLQIGQQLTIPATLP